MKKNCLNCLFKKKVGKEYKCKFKKINMGPKVFYSNEIPEDHIYDKHGTRVCLWVKNYRGLSKFM